MSKKDKPEEEIPEGQKKTAISDKEKKRIMDEHGSYIMTEEEWIEKLNEYDEY